MTARRRLGGEMFKPRTAEVVWYCIAGSTALVGFESIVITVAAGLGTIGFVGGLPIGVIIAAGLAWVVRRSVTTRLVVRDDAVVIKNLFRAHELPRRELVSITAEGKWIVASTATEAVRVHAISAGWQWTLKRRAAEWNTRLGLDPA